MKPLIFLLVALSMTGCTSLVATTATTTVTQRIGSTRQEVRFLTDKMAYELRLSPQQYNDVYEINYDFLYAANQLMDDIVYGDSWALDRYYEVLDLRNDDLRWVLSNSQYRRFLRIDYFYRPLYLDGGTYWAFRVYATYPNRSLFYYDVPHHYHTYNGAHCRRSYDNASYYRDRYIHVHHHYDTPVFVRNDRSYRSYRDADFGSVRRNSSTRGSVSGRTGVSARGRVMTDEGRIYSTRSGDVRTENGSRRDNGRSVYEATPDRSRRSEANRSEQSSRRRAGTWNGTETQERTTGSTRTPSTYSRQQAEPSTETRVETRSRSERSEGGTSSSRRYSERSSSSNRR